MTDGRLAKLLSIHTESEIVAKREIFGRFKVAKMDIN